MDDSQQLQPAETRFDPFTAELGNLPTESPPIKRDRLGRRLDTRPAKRGNYVTSESVEKNRIDVNMAVKLRVINKLTYDEIGKQFGVTGAAICKRIKSFKNLLLDPESVEAYRNHRSEIFDVAESTLITQIVDPNKLKQASTNNVAYVLRQLHDMGRLERGQSTANIAVLAGLSEGDKEWLQSLSTQLMGRMIAQDAGE